MKCALVLLGAAGVLLMTTGRADEAHKPGESAVVLKSPDGKWMATAEAAKGVGRPRRESHVQVKVVAADGSEDRAGTPGFTWEGALAKMQWSPDSLFLVTTFAEPPHGYGGPGYPAVIWQASDDTFRHLNGYFPDGYVADPEIEFEEGDSLRLSIQPYARLEEPLRVHVPLAEAVQRMLPVADDRENADPINLESPDGMWRAVARTTYDEEMLWNTDFNGFRLFIIRQGQEDEIWRFKGDGPDARSIADMQWSPDSKYVVMTTVSSGGHSPINTLTYVYSVADNTFRSISDPAYSISAFSPNPGTNRWVTDRAIGFVAPNTVLLGIYAPIENVAEDRTYTVAIPLDREIAGMKKVVKSDEDLSEAEDPFKVFSPDGKWFAAARQIPDEKRSWKKSLDHFRLVVGPMESLETGFNVFQYDGPGGRVEGMRWSPDSRYLIIPTWNAGAMRYNEAKLAVYCVADSSVRDLSGYLAGFGGVDTAVDFQGENTLVLRKLYGVETKEIVLSEIATQLERMKPESWVR